MDLFTSPKFGSPLSHRSDNIALLRRLYHIRLSSKLPNKEEISATMEGGKNCSPGGIIHETIFPPTQNKETFLIIKEYIAIISFVTSCNSNNNEKETMEILEMDIPDELGTLGRSPEA